MFDFIKRWRAEKMGQEAGRAMTSDVDEYIAHVIVPRMTSGLEVFEGRLATVWDTPEYEPSDIALVERKIFEETLSSYIGEFEAMVRIHMYKWDSVFDQMPEVRGRIDEFITQRVGERATNGRAIADRMVELTFEEIDRRKKTSSETGVPYPEWKALQAVLKTIAPST